MLHVLVMAMDVTRVALNRSELSQYSNNNKYIRFEFITDRITTCYQTEHVLYAYKTYLDAFRLFSKHNKHILWTQANKIYSSVRPGKTYILEEVIKQ